LERAGLGHVVWQVEAGRFQREVLARHWPDAVRYRHVQSLGRTVSPAPVDLICGGFPCQDLSRAGSQAGLVRGERSSLFFEVARAVGVVRPRFVVLENVPEVLSADYGLVLGSLATLGYDAWWDCVPAAALGAPHVRDRWFLIGWLADANREEPQRGGEHRKLARSAGTTSQEGNAAAIPPLAVAVKMWPTPTSSDGSKGSGESVNRQGGPSLTSAVRWSTPTARDWRSGRVSPDIFERNTRPLSEQVEYGSEEGSMLNPAWVELLMGFPAGWVTSPG
jgi:DNA (cytosine-5)-methyltransferase 1